MSKGSGHRPGENYADNWDNIFSKKLVELEEAPAQPEQETTRPCRSCGGTGERFTGVDESPTTTCKPCDGAGQIAVEAQPKQEPVAYVVYPCTFFKGSSRNPELTFTKPELSSEDLIVNLYTSQPQREWVGLTDKEFQWCADENWPMIRVAEMLKEKNA